VSADLSVYTDAKSATAGRRDRLSSEGRFYA
jgi:hypothetical protein